jgi:photosystem II stability/assembly factor-like uncharacterized protein
LAYAAGLYRIFSTTGGGTWQQVGEAPFPIHKMVFPPDTPGLILAASDGGLLASTDAGAHWQAQSLGGLALTTLLLDSAQPQRLYAGTSSNGVLRSNDQGVTWTGATDGVPYGSVVALAGSSTNPDVVLAGVEQLTPQGGFLSGDILRTTDGGATWTVVSPPNINTPLDIAVCAADPSTVYAAARSGLLKSTDGGQTFPVTLLPGKDVDVVALDSTCNTLYVTVFADGVYSSPDAGTTWSPAALTNGMMLTAPTYAHPLAVSPHDAQSVLASSNAGLFVTTNGGQNWALANGVVAISPGVLSVSSLEPGRLWMGTYGTGLWSRFPNMSWGKPKTDVAPYVFTVLADSSHAQRVFAGTQPGLWESPDDGSTFSDLFAPGDVSAPENILAVAPDPTNPSIVYAGGEALGVYKSTDGGAHWATSNGTLTPWATSVGNFLWVSAVLVDPAAPTHVIIGTNRRGLYKSVDSAGSWNPIVPVASAALVEDLLATSGAGAALYASVPGVGILKSTDGGDMWSTLTTGLTSLDVTKLAVDSTTGNLFVVTEADGVFESRDQGATWAPFYTDCLATSRLGSGIAVLNNGSAGNTLVVAGPGGVLAHPL